MAEQSEMSQQAKIKYLERMRRCFRKRSRESRSRLPDDVCGYSLLGTPVLAPVSAPANDSAEVEFEITLELPAEALLADQPGLFREKFVVSILLRAALLAARPHPRL